MADTLVDDYDLVELLQFLVDTCRDVLDMSAAGILLADARGQLEVVASTSEASMLVEMMQLSAEAGPCVESYRTGHAVEVPDIAASTAGMDAVPRQRTESGLRLRGCTSAPAARCDDRNAEPLRATVGPAPAEDVVAAQAFADVATIGILHERSLRESELITEQLQAALNSRVIIEQAKGVISQVRGIPIDEAFDLMREYARSHQMRLSLVASSLVERTLSL